MKIAFVWPFEKASWVFPFFRDGLRAAVEVIAKSHEVTWYLDGKFPEVGSCDYILVWDDSRSKFLDVISQYKCPKGLCLTTDLGADLESLKNYGAVFAEAQSVVDFLKPRGVRVYKAFGTDTKFFSPQGKNKLYKHFYPATFSPWKRQNIFADKYGADGLCLGTVQPDGWDIYHYAESKGTKVITGYLPAEMCRDLYDMSEHVDVTGWEGSGRTILEAMSMGLPVDCAEDNHKCQDYLREFKESGLAPREFVLEHYSEEKYASIIMKGINE